MTINDTDDEPDETFTVSLYSPSGGVSIGDPDDATVTITDNDNPPSGFIQLQSATFMFIESIGSATITAVRINGSFGAVSVAYTTGDGTATAGSDYTATSGRLTWAAGETGNKMFSVPINNDTATESHETFSVSLSDPMGTTLGPPSAASVTIADNDGSP